MSLRGPELLHLSTTAEDGQGNVPAWRLAAKSAA